MIDTLCFDVTLLIQPVGNTLFRCLECKQERKLSIFRIYIVNKYDSKAYTINIT